MKRKIKVFSVEAITKTTAPSTFEFVLHVPSEYDYRFTSELRDDIILTLKEIYLRLQSKNLPIYGIVASNLKDYVTTKADKKKNVTRMPDSQYRLTSEDLVLEATSKSVSGSESGFDESFLKGQCVYFSHKEDTKIKTSDFKFVKFLKKNVYECNYLVECIPLAKTLLMKEFKKSTLLDTSKITKTKIEDEVYKFEGKFFAHPKFVFQTSTGLYFFFETTPETDLSQLLEKCKRLPEQQVQFYTAQLTLALQQLHHEKTSIRDLRPENIWFDSKGYILLNPYSIYQFLDEKKQKQIASKEDISIEQEKYLPPEFVAGELTNSVMDWWSLGIVVYKMLVGITPYFARDYHILREQIASKPVRYPDPIKHHIYVSDAARDLISKVKSHVINSC